MGHPKKENVSVLFQYTPIYLQIAVGSTLLSTINKNRGEKRYISI